MREERVPAGIDVQRGPQRHGHDFVPFDLPGPTVSATAAAAGVVSATQIMVGHVRSLRALLKD